MGGKELGLSLRTLLGICQEHIGRVLATRTCQRSLWEEPRVLPGCGQDSQIHVSSHRALQTRAVSPSLTPPRANRRGRGVSAGQGPTGALGVTSLTFGLNVVKSSPRPRSANSAPVFCRGVYCPRPCIQVPDPL